MRVRRSWHSFCCYWITCGQNGKGRVWATKRSALQAKSHSLGCRDPGQVLICIWTSVYLCVKWKGITHHHVSIIKVPSDKTNALMCQVPLIQVLSSTTSISIILIYRWQKHGIEELNTLPNITQSVKQQSGPLHPGTQVFRCGYLWL